MPTANLNTQPPARKGSSKSRRPAYFLSISVENIRSFGSKQTLNLSRNDGRPAAWTIILGDNGTGKTTLLQCISMLEPKYVTYPEHDLSSHLVPSCASLEWKTGYFFEKLMRSESSSLSCSFIYGPTLNEDDQKRVKPHFVDYSAIAEKQRTANLDLNYQSAKKASPVV